MNVKTAVIAIDGPSASGKSSTAREVAARLGLVHLDSGALYRLVTMVALRSRLRDPGAIVAALDRHQVGLSRNGNSTLLSIDGEDAEPEIRSPAVTAAVSDIAAMREVRDWVNQRLRAAAAEWGRVVMDGRDIGTDVFPDAELKIYLTATAEERARRRLRQVGRDIDADAVAMEAGELAERDRRDAARDVAPLRQAEDALLLDTTTMTFEEQVGWIVARAS